MPNIVVCCSFIKTCGFIVWVPLPLFLLFMYPRLAYIRHVKWYCQCLVDSTKKCLSSIALLFLVPIWGCVKTILLFPYLRESSESIFTHLRNLSDLTVPGVHLGTRLLSHSHTSERFSPKRLIPRLRFKADLRLWPESSDAAR